MRASSRHRLGDVNVEHKGGPVSGRAPVGRRSIGGAVVEESLRSAGYDLEVGEVALVETRRPRRRPFSAVLAQNAWNFVPASEFEGLLAPYPREMKPRMRMRRVVAGVNVARAETVVCLSEAMATLVRSHQPRVAEKVVVAPVWLPMDFSSAALIDAPPQGDWALVPGTVTWYKGSLDAINVARRLGLDRIHFVGDDDGSGCWHQIVRVAERSDIDVSRETLGRSEMLRAYLEAGAVILPSRLESLGFGLSEALALGRRVVATNLPAHLELAKRMRREPAWLPALSAVSTAPMTAYPPMLDKANVGAAWTVVGQALGLPRSTA